MALLHNLAQNTFNKNAKFSHTWVCCVLKKLLFTLNADPVTEGIANSRLVTSSSFNVVQCKQWFFFSVLWSKFSGNTLPDKTDSKSLLWKNQKAFYQQKVNTVIQFELWEPSADQHWVKSHERYLTFALQITSGWLNRSSPGLRGITIMFLIFQIKAVHYSNNVCLFMYKRACKLCWTKIKNKHNWCYNRTWVITNIMISTVYGSEKREEKSETWILII